MTGDQSRYIHLGLNLPSTSSGGSTGQGPSHSNMQPIAIAAQGPTIGTNSPQLSTPPVTQVSSAAIETQSSAAAPRQAQSQPRSPNETPVPNRQRKTVPPPSPRTRIIQLEAELAVLQASNLPGDPLHHSATRVLPVAAPQPEPLLCLFEDDATLARIKDAMTIKEESGRRLPDIIPGFKANTLDLGKLISISY